MIKFINLLTVFTVTYAQLVPPIAVQTGWVRRALAQPLRGSIHDLNSLTFDAQQERGPAAIAIFIKCKFGRREIIIPGII